MKVKVLAAEHLSFPNKETGELIDLTRIWVCSLTSENTKGPGSAYYIGHRLDKINIPKTLTLSDNEITSMVGKDVDLIYEQTLGRKYPSLQKILVL